jgi:hypothetical protein
MDLGRLALLFVVPLFIFDWLLDKSRIQARPNIITITIVLACLAIGTGLTIAAWIKGSVDRNSRIIASIPFGALDVYLLLPFAFSALGR